MKGDTDYPTRKLKRTVTRTELVLASIIICLLLRLYYPHVGLSSPAKPDEDDIFICHAPQPSLLNHHEIDRSAFDSDIKWVRDLLDGVVKGDNGYGQGADSVTLSIFLPNGSPIYEEGFGKVKANESHSSRPNGNSIYRMASITKMFTTAQLILQKQQGKLDLDEEVSHILKDFQPSSKGWTGPGESRKITTRQLLSHTSGILRDPKYDIAWPDSPPVDNVTVPETMVSRAEEMALIRDTPATMPLSTVPVYSNIAFDVAGFVAEEIAQVPYRDLLDRDLFTPLKMSSASFEWKPNLLEHVIVPAEPFSPWVDLAFGDTDPSGGLFVSAADLRRFGQELLGTGIDGGSSKGIIYSKNTVRDWLRPIHIFDDGLMSIGLSWEIFTVPVGTRRMSLYSKGGTLPGFHTLFGVDPEREFGYSLLISGEPTGNTALGIRIMKRFAETLDKQRQNILGKKFAGIYRLDDSDWMKIDLVDGGLAMTGAVIGGVDIFKWLRLGEGEGDYVAMWPTGEPNAWRLAIGRPPAQPYLGCMHKFASIDPAYSRGFPIDLVVFEDGTLIYGALNQTFVRR